MAVPGDIEHVVAGVHYSGALSEALQLRLQPLGGFGIRLQIIGGFHTSLSKESSSNVKDGIDNHERRQRERGEWHNAA
jgi:hypothetical protein